MRTVYELGPFRLDTEARALTHDGVATALGARGVAVLAVLVSRVGEYVEKSVIVDAAWPGVVVEEANLAVQISAIRRVLARAPHGEHWIETLTRRGYRFVGPVVEMAGRSTAPLVADRKRTNLPEQLTSFIGREREFGELKELLATTRLLLLRGPGGIGKTRLALQAAADLVAEYPDGIWLVELAPLADPRLVPQAVASVLNVKEVPGQALTAALLAHLGNRRLLIVLDNCEHLIEGAAELVHDLLRSTSQVKMLVTSREPLRVPGETCFQLPPLGIPDPRADIDLATLSQCESVRLFMARASAVNAAFALKPDNIAAVRSICYRLDGIPLALELAAARMRSLSVEQIDARLVDCFRLLSHGDRTAVTRQRTLQASIDWSHNLLSESERIVFRRLAVFAGGWSMQAAEDVTAQSDIDRADVVDLLGNLVEKSLVLIDGDGGRYRLLETIRQYAQERLDEAGENDATRNRHLHHYLSVIDGSDVGQSERFARMDRELENLLSAHAWCGSTPEGGELGLRLIKGLRGYFLQRGAMALGRRIMAEALARPGAQVRNLIRSEALSAAGYHSYFMGQTGEARQLLEESVSIARELGERRQAALSLFQLATVHMSWRDFDKARQNAEESLRLAHAIGDAGVTSRALETQALICRAEGNSLGAEPLFRESLLYERRAGGGNSVAIAGILTNLAACVMQRYAAGEAHALLRDALASAAAVESKWRVTTIVDMSSALAALDRDFERAARYHGAAESLLAETGLTREPDDELMIAPFLAQAIAALGSDAFGRLEAQGRAWSYAQDVAELRAWLGREG